MVPAQIYIVFAVSFFLTLFGCNTVEDEPYVSPAVISGRVADDQAHAISSVRLSLPTATTFSPVFTDPNGLYYMKGFPAGKHRLRAEKIGFETFETDVPRPINGVATVNPVLTRKIYNVPAEKPVGSGMVRINNKKLEVDFDGNGVYEEFVVKGVAFSPAPIGGKPWTKEVYDRSIVWLNDLNANTVRTYSGVDKYFLQQAAAHNIRVIVSFWVNTDLDLSQNSIRQTLIDDFATMVLDLKDFPAVLIWNIGNEQNYQNGNSPYWYSLVQEMAVAAYKVEGEKYHPVCASNGNLYNIGNAGMNANDASLTYVDLWGSNAYEMNFMPFFASYRTKSTKPIVITEFGIDALNNATKTEYESVQAEFDSTNWVQIRAASDVCVGATVFEFTDEWWKAGDANNHDFGGYETNQHPDGYSNEEWWGIVAVTPDADNDGMDEWRARKAFSMFKRNWK
ncbi:MAG: carboxypeptidase regulatory-like domain-containing protein [Bacteroidota bacterium]